MPTIAIVGAGPGLGLSIGKVFGRNGFSVALVSRTQEKLDHLAAQLGEHGIQATGFAADVMDRPALAAAFARIRRQYGAVDVLEYPPAPHNPVPGITSLLLPELPQNAGLWNHSPASTWHQTGITVR